MSAIDIPYLIVGAGPVGLTAAQLLAANGERCLVVERREGPQRHPAAHVVNARSLEIFRQAGVDMQAVHEVAKPPADAGHVNYVTRLNGQLIGRLPFERQGPEVYDLSPTPLRNISQHRLEPIMAKSLLDDPLVDLRYSTVWESSKQDDAGVTTSIRDLATDEVIQVRSRYVLAADGAGSRVRKSLGITMVGPPALQSFVAIHIAADLRELVADRLGVLHFVMDPAVSGAFIAHDVDREWVFMVSYDPTEESLDDYDSQRCLSLVRKALGDDDVPVDIIDAGVWHMSAQIASAMRDDRVFLVGDAAHRFPPTGGLGLNTGVADAHNLVWKLLAVENSWADPCLLDTYGQERLPVAGANCEQSTTNAFQIVSLIEALGITTTPTTEGLLATLADPANQDKIDAAVQDQATHFDMIGLQLGYCYNDGAVARDDDAVPPIEDPRVFEPKGQVGTRLPHAWIGDGRSTLDLVDMTGFTLITCGAHDTWAEQFASSDAPLRHVRLGEEISVSTDWQTQCGLSDEAALLVRPDQHIAWRSSTEPGAHVDTQRILARIVGA